MSFKKFALLILTFVGIIGICTKPVSASAKEDVYTVSQVVSVQAAPASQSAVDTQKKDTPKKDTKKTKKSKKKTTKKKAKKKAKYTKSELRLMASIINCEAGGECYQGKLAVGVVIMNRIKSKAFPNTLKKVIYQRGQFSPVRNGSLKKRLSQYDAGKIKSSQWKSCIKAAKKVLGGQKTIVLKGKVKNMSGYHFFSVRLPKARFKLGGHRFK